MIAAGGISALAEGFVEDDGSGGGDVEGADAAGHGDAEQVVAGLADEVVQACAFPAEDENAVAGEVELVVVGRTALVETDNPQILPFEVFEGADQINDASDAEVLGSSGAGFDGDWAQGRGAALGEDDAVDAGAVGYAEQSAEVLRVFDAVEGEQQTVRACFCGGWAGREQVFDGEEFLRADQGDYTLVSGSFGQLSELVAGFLADADAGLTEGGYEVFEALVFAFAGYKHVVEASPAGLERLFHRVHAVQNFHEG